MSEKLEGFNGEIRIFSVYERVMGIHNARDRRQRLSIQTPSDAIIQQPKCVIKRAYFQKFEALIIARESCSYSKTVARKLKNTQ